MRKEDLDRRSAELKARMLAERRTDARPKSADAAVRESVSSLKQADQVTVVVGETKSETGEVAALKKRIAQLEAENESLRQLISSRNEREPSPSRSNDDSVREQRHNFFKYSNVRKY